jgi:hypothetical protein
MLTFVPFFFRVPQVGNHCHRGTWSQCTGFPVHPVNPFKVQWLHRAPTRPKLKNSEFCTNTINFLDRYSYKNNQRLFVVKIMSRNCLRINLNRFRPIQTLVDITSNTFYKCTETFRTHCIIEVHFPFKMVIPAPPVTKQDIQCGFYEPNAYVNTVYTSGLYISSYYIVRAIQCR